MLTWGPALKPGWYTVRARLIYDLNRDNDRRLTSDQTEIYRAALPVQVAAPAK